MFHVRTGRVNACLLCLERLSNVMASILNFLCSWQNDLGRLGTITVATNAIWTVRLSSGGHLLLRVSMKPLLLSQTTPSTTTTTSAWGRSNNSKVNKELSLWGMTALLSLDKKKHNNKHGTTKKNILATCSSSVQAGTFSFCHACPFVRSSLSLDRVGGQETTTTSSCDLSSSNNSKYDW